MSLSEVVKRYYDLVDANRVEEIVDLFASDGCYRRPGYPAFVGHAALTRFWGEERVIASGTHAIRSLLESDFTVAVQGDFKGVLKSGSNVNIGFADFWRFNREELVAERESYFFSPAV